MSPAFLSSLPLLSALPTQPRCLTFRPSPLPILSTISARTSIPNSLCSNANHNDRATNFSNVSWQQVEQMVSKLSKLSKPHNFDTVLAITRGGLVPATLLSETLQLRNVLSATVMFYTDTGDQFFGMTEPRFLAFPSIDALEGRRVLVVDDVWDSGRTAHAVKKRVERARADVVMVAVMHYKPPMNAVPVEPDFYAETTESWIIYPWERASPVVVEEIGDIVDGLVADQDATFGTSHTHDI